MLISSWPAPRPMRPVVLEPAWNGSQTVVMYKVLSRLLSTLLTAVAAAAVLVAVPQAAQATTPEVTITPRQTVYGVGGSPIVYDIVFAENVTGLATSDFSIARSFSGTSTLAGSGSTYTLTITYTNSSGNFTLDVTLNRATVTTSGTPTTSLPSSAVAATRVTLDLNRPTVSLTRERAFLVSSTTVVTLTFSEAVQGFDASDLVLGGTSTGWAISSLVQSTSDPRVWTVQLAKSAPGRGTITVTVPSGAVQDAAGNTGPATSASSSMETYGDIINGSVRVEAQTGEIGQWVSDGEIRGITVGPDGSIYAVGETRGGTPSMTIAKWRSDGMLVTALSILPTSTLQNVGAWAVQLRDGYIYAAGHSMDSNANVQATVVKFDTDLNLVTTFGSNGILQFSYAADDSSKTGDFIFGAAFDRDGHLVVTGARGTWVNNNPNVGTTAAMGLAVIDPATGSLITSKLENGRVVIDSNPSAEDVGWGLVHVGDSYGVFGRSQSTSGTTRQGAIWTIRVADGSVTQLAFPASTTLSFRAFVEDPSGGYITGSQYSNVVCKFRDLTGATASFGTNGCLTLPNASWIGALATDGTSFFATGMQSGSSIYTAKFNSSGVLDSGYGVGGRRTAVSGAGYAWAAATHAGELVIGGSLANRYIWYVNRSGTASGLRSQQITVSALTALLPTETQQITATTNSGLAVTLSAASGSVCTLANGVITAVSAGTCTVNIQASGDTTWEPASTTASFQVLAPPSAPAAPTLTAGNAQVTATWNIPASPGTPVTGFVVRFFTAAETCASTSNEIQISSGNITTETIGSLINDTGYFVCVAAVNRAGTGAFSPDSASATPSAVTLPVAQSPTAFSNQLPVVNVTPSSVRPDALVQIDASISCASPLAMRAGAYPPSMYYIVNGTRINGFYRQANLAGTSATWTISVNAPPANGTYSVQVYTRDNPNGPRCSGSASQFTWSTSVPLVVTTAPVGAIGSAAGPTSLSTLVLPDQVGGFEVTRNESTFRATWRALSDTSVNRYALEYSANAGPWVRLPSTDIDTSVSGALPTNSGIVVFRVAAGNAVGLGPWSNPATLRLQNSEVVPSAQVPVITASTLSATPGERITLTATVTCSAPMSTVTGSLWPSMFYILWSQPFINDSYASPTLSVDGRTATWTVVVTAPQKLGVYRLQAYGRDNPQGVFCLGDSFQFTYSAAVLVTVAEPQLQGPTPSPSPTQTSTQSSGAPVSLGGPVVASDVVAFSNGATVTTGVSGTTNSDGSRTVVLEIPEIVAKTVAVTEEFAGNIPGVQDITFTIDGKAIVTLDAMAKGIVSIPIEVSSAEIGPIRTLLQVAVAPATVSVVRIRPISAMRSLIRWSSTASGLVYKVIVNGKLVCTTEELTCVVRGLIGPNSRVDILSVTADGIASAATSARASSYGSFEIQRVGFSAGGTALTKEMRESLTRLASSLVVAGFTRVRVIGYSSDDRSPTNARALSRARATSVANFLLQRAPQLKVTASYVGARQLVNANRTEQERSANRRVTVRVLASD